MSVKSKNITWHEGQVSRTSREELLGQKGVTIWLTGLSGSGKSTVAVAAEAALRDQGRLTYILDGDNVRQGLNSNLGFSPEDRRENVRRVGEVAQLFTDAGVLVCCAFISPYRSDRDRAREAVRDGSFHEIFIRASLETCEARDPKGLYSKARAGEIEDFTGISAPYEEPTSPELVIDTEQSDPEQSIEALVAYCRQATNV